MAEREPLNPRLADQRERDRALQAGRSFIVQAPAGSGKTELLTRRFLRLLAGVERPEQVLAITFTRKATQEMRERIVGRLEQAAGKVVPGSAYERAVAAEAEAVLARDRALNWRLISNPGRLQILTIDSLCARLSAGSPQLGRGLAGMSVVEDAAALYGLAANRLLQDLGWVEGEAEASAALVRVLTHLQGDSARFARLLADMLGCRDHWLDQVSDTPGRRNAAMRGVQELELDYLTSRLGQEPLRELIDALTGLAAHAEQPPSETLGEALRECVSEQASVAERVHSLSVVLTRVATREGQPLKARSINRRFFAGTHPQRSVWIGNVRAVLARWAHDPSSKAAFARFVACPPRAVSDADQAVLSDLQTLLKFAVAELRVLFAEQGLCDFQHVAELALDALGDADRPGDALLAADLRLSHILVDEFQDTSRMQYQLLERLVAGWQPGDGRSLFLVGDPMQSIYRFRQAEVGLFARAVATGRVGPVAVERLQLGTNFRCSPELVAWINGQFEPIFDRADGPCVTQVGYARFRPARTGPGRVIATPWPESLGDDAEAEAVAERAADRLGAMAEGDIAILARTRAQLAPIATALSRAGIGFEAVEVEHLGDRPVVRDLLAFTRAIVHPADRVAWLALLRAPWCGLDVSQLHAVAGADAQVDILARLQDSAVAARLPDDCRQRVERLAETMVAVSEARGNWPLHRLVEAAWVGCGGPYAVTSQDELQQAGDFFALLATTEAERPDDVLDALQTRLASLYAAARGARVKLMTVHKAKGLEFAVVVLPGLHRTARGRGRPLVRFHSGMGEAGGAPLMAPFPRSDGDESTLYDYLGQLENEQEAAEMRRVLYVACTRAKRELHLFGAVRLPAADTPRQPVPPVGSFMELLWPCFPPLIKGCPGSLRQAASDAEPRLLPQLVLREVPAPVAMPICPGPGEGAMLRIPERDATALGEALHFWLQCLHEYPERRWSADWFRRHCAAVDASLLRAGATEEGLTVLRESLVAMVARALESAELRAMWSPRGKRASWAELPLYRREGVQLRRYVLDRLFVDADGAWVIVDYKTGRSDEASEQAWSRQLQGYAELVAELAPGMTVRTAVQAFRPADGAGRLRGDAERVLTRTRETG